MDVRFSITIRQRASLRDLIEVGSGAQVSLGIRLSPPDCMS